MNSRCRDSDCIDFVCRTGFWYVFEVGKWDTWDCGTKEHPRTCWSAEKMDPPPIVFSKENQVFSPAKQDRSRTSEVEGPIFRQNFCEDYNECDDTLMKYDPNKNPVSGYFQYSITGWII